MSKQGFNKRPGYSVGDSVIAVGPSNAYRGKQGVVVEIIEPGGDLVYRYVVRFGDGSTGTFFGFELQLL
jgi:hypothetical protein